MSNVAGPSRKVWREVPLAFWLAFGVQTSGIVWAAAKADARIETNRATEVRNQKQITVNQQGISRLTNGQAQQAITLGKIGVTLDNINQLIRQIDRKLEQSGG